MFGVLVAIGIVVGSRLTLKRGAELGLPAEDTSQMITWSLVGGFAFAHLFDVFAYQMSTHAITFWDVLNPFSGLSSFGGFMGALIGLFAWADRHKQPVMPYADSLAYGLAAGWLFGRLGCFTAHDHPGHFTYFFLAVKYPEGARHDLGLDEALFALAVAGLFYLLARQKRALGLYVALLPTLYGPVRFLLDFLRATDVPEPDPRYFGLTPAQYGSILCFAAGIAVIARLRRYPKPAV
jgi:phosphatidylglycerol:prolipoprotein diacylglycerol transferase